MNIKAELLTKYTAEILTKLNSPPQEAETVAKELVMANLAGVDSHGVLRISQYYNDTIQGHIKPGAPIEIIKETPVSAVVDFNHNFGQVGAIKMTQKVIEKAKKSGMACAISLHASHVGRLGSYTDMIASAGLAAFATVAVYSIGPMQPWGGKGKRLGTNPISWAAPRENGPNIVFDIATTAVSEGKIRTYIQRGENIPTGWIKDAEGNDTNDPNAFYTPKPGSIYPLGGATEGYKGSGLAIMANIFTMALANDEYWKWLTEKKGNYPNAQNGMFIMAIDPDIFFGREAFCKMAEQHAMFIKSSEPNEGIDEIMLPGEIEYRSIQKKKMDGIEIPETTFEQIKKIAKELDCSWVKEI